MRYKVELDSWSSDEVIWRWSLRVHVNIPESDVHPSQPKKHAHATAFPQLPTFLNSRSKFSPVSVAFYKQPLRRIFLGEAHFGTVAPSNPSKTALLF